MSPGHDGFPPSGRPGMRSNAIPAVSFIKLRVVDARVSDAVLDVLEDAGVAAYVEPSAGEVGIYRDVRSYRAPSDELYVDAARRGIADSVIAAELPGMLADLAVEPVDDDDAFDAIVAKFDEAGPEDWPATKNATAPATDTTDHDGDWYAARAPATVADDDHFVPPPPPPIPFPTGAKLWGLLMLVGGVVMMGALPFLGFEREESMVMGIITMAAGAGTLVWRMRDVPPDSDPDDGAVV